jgi:hypothetical protein
MNNDELFEAFKEIETQLQEVIWKVKKIDVEIVNREMLKLAQEEKEEEEGQGK